MTTYPKIETLFNRKPDFSVDRDLLRREEYGLVSEWVLTEKIDGTNMRLLFTRGGDGSVTADIRGKSDNAQLPPQLFATLTEWARASLPLVTEIMDRYGLSDYVLFGEGYGPKIQSGGRYRSLSQDQAFVLFDVLAGSSWLDEQQITDTATELLIDRVPIVLAGASLNDAVDLCLQGFASDHAEVFDESFMAEGVVAKPPVPLYDRRGDRVMWKLKNRDFRAGKR